MNFYILKTQKKWIQCARVSVQNLMSKEWHRCYTSQQGVHLPIRSTHPFQFIFSSIINGKNCFSFDILFVIAVIITFQCIFFA
jgi:hypothetical protein